MKKIKFILIFIVALPVASYFSFKNYELSSDEIISLGNSFVLNDSLLGLYKSENIIFDLTQGNQCERDGETNFVFSDLLESVFTKKLSTYGFKKIFFSTEGITLTEYIPYIHFSAILEKNNLFKTQVRIIIIYNNSDERNGNRFGEYYNLELKNGEWVK